MEDSQSLSVGASIDSYISECVKKILDQTRFPPEPDKMPETLEEILQYFFIIHIRYWHTEDSMAQVKSDREFVHHLSQADIFAKQKRPHLTALLDKYFIQLCNKKMNTCQSLIKEEV